MIKLAELEAFLDDLYYYDKGLDLKKLDTHLANGLQVRGEPEIKKIGLAVSASLTVFKIAVEKKCQALITHHGLDYPNSKVFHQIFQKRYGYLIKNNLSLFGYHFLMDSHPKIGHNILILKLLGVMDPQPFFSDDAPWGFMGHVPPTSIEQVMNKLKTYLSPEYKLYPFGNKLVKKIAACSGSGVPYSSDLQYYLQNKIDFYITGEVSEWVRELFHEAKVSYLAGGHYHTERFGLLELQKILKSKLNVDVEFLEYENEV